jgi:type I restriction enzyme R subunit
MTPPTYLEQDFEDHIEHHLLGSGYHTLLPSEYDKENCFISTEVLQFIQSSQPKEYEKLQGQLGADTDRQILYRLSSETSKYGALHVLRKGFKTRGTLFHMAYFKPASGMNPEVQFLYQQNRFSIVRQLKYSTRNENSLDMVIFLNGIPIITAELKNSLTGQFVEEAIKQYEKDRDPREQLFKFKRCLVHFAVGNEKVFMTTRLQEDKTRFLPFNLDTENPINPNGHKTAYLWEDILQPDTLLNLIQNYLHVQVNTEKYYDKDSGTVKEREYEVFIFPRFHQLDSVRKLLRAVKDEGVGHNYLIQHSAGSGKSNSIAWLSHQLASFYQKGSDTERLFDSIIVVTDRRVLDKQLQNTIKQFEQVQGVVRPIEKNSAQLREALEKGKDIIVTTLQKFPVISESMTKLQGKRFVVIIDEAHSSQSGESSKHLKKVLSVNLEQAEEEDRDDFDLEDEIVKEISYRGRQPHISYFAFTATPKGKTLELFGRKNEDGHFTAFHTYSMRQAIEEGFILDVLENYTTFKRYFKLAKKVENDKEYEKKKALRLLMSYVDLHPHEIEMKSRIMLEHFLDKTVNAIQGRGRAMIVTRSRLHAVRFYLTFKRLIKEMGLNFKPLVAFSGTVKDPETGPEYTEKRMNELPPRVSIENAYKTPEYRILIVANKFQTGFDERMLHTMYVDKKLGGVNAVQTLSRLNRTMRGKDNTLILDFVNEVEEIQEAFQDYYQRIFLEEETDPDKLHDLQNDLEGYGLYTEPEIDAFAEIFYHPTEPMEKLQPILDAVVERWEALPDDNDREHFRSTLQSYIRLYGYISQIISFKNVDLEKLYVFARNLNRKLPKKRDTLPYEIRDAIDLESFRIQETYSEYKIKLVKTNGEAKGIKLGAPMHTEDEKDFLSNIIKTLNDIYGIDLNEDDKLDIGRMQEKLKRRDDLRSVMTSDNTLENMRYKFDKVVDELLLDFVHTKLDLYKKLSDPKVNPVFKSKWFEGYLRESKADSVEDAHGV